MRSLPAILLALLVLPVVHADPIPVPVPGPGTIGTPAFIDIPYTCDPVGLACVGPVHEPAPVGVFVEAGGFVLVVDPTGTPGSVFGPSYHNVTVGSVTVPVVLCPNGCTIPTTPTTDVEGGVGVGVSGPFACSVSLLEPTSVSCDPLGCDPLASGGCGLPDPSDYCLREDTDEVPDCFVVTDCGSLGGATDCLFVLLDFVLEVAGEVLGLVPSPDELCVEGTFPSCLSPCYDDPEGCVPPLCDPGDLDGCAGLPCNPAVLTTCGPFLYEWLSLVIKPCSETDKSLGVYVCWTTNQGLITQELGLPRLYIKIGPLQPLLL